MHWIIQGDLHTEAGLTELRQVLERAEIPHSLHDVLPGGHTLEPEAAPEGRVMVVGGYSLTRIAQERGWSPGSFPVPDHSECVTVWGAHMLNSAYHYTTTHAAASAGEPWPFDGPFFMRPVADSKKFTGRVFADRAEFIAWEGGRTPVVVLMSPLREIYRETRVWIVGEFVVTASVYKEGGTVRYDAVVSDDVIQFARERAREWQPAPAYVMDIAETPDGLRIVEINNINAAGFYAANVGRIVGALEGLVPYEDQEA